MTRFKGKFVRETDGYGFFVGAKDAAGNPPSNLPELGGIFLSGATARKTLGRAMKNGLLKSIDGSFFTFLTRESETHPGKLEAYDVQDPTPPYSF